MGLEAMRLDRYLGHAVALTRSQAQRVIRRGKVRVDGVRITDPGHHVEPGAQVVLAEEIIAAPTARYLMLHKPPGYVCSTDDPLHPTVLALLDMADRRDLHIAGRLDLDATGLVLVTDDGAWSHRVTSPRHHRSKVYRVELAEPLTEAAAEQLRAGVQLHGEKRPTRPARVEPLDERQARLTIEEGRYHQVKRMFAAVGNRVLTLHRERIGCVALDPALAPGEWRPLTAEEIACLGA